MPDLADIRHDDSAALFKSPAYSRDRGHLPEQVAALTRHHYERCAPYRNILAALRVDPAVRLELADVPALPVGLFKRLDLVSVPPAEVCRVLTSSGTSGVGRSRVFLDRSTSILQMRALASIVSSFIGEARLPLLVIDAPRRQNGDSGYQGRAVAIQGFSMFGTRIAFALTETMQPDLGAIRAFLEEVRGRPFLLFGFTYVIWRYFLAAIDALDLASGSLIHGGGWKRLARENISDHAFRARVRERTGVVRVHDYYGMVEQPGSIYMQCEEGYLHCSHFSEIFIRRPHDLSAAERGEPGIIQTISVLPRSYPGHNLLTEDMGVLHGDDDCGCGRCGKYFRVIGRLPTAEPKGCGDTHPL